MATSNLLYCLSVLSLLPFIASITIPLSPSHPNPNPTSDGYQRINHHVLSSLTRAYHLKNPQITSTTTQIFSHSYGAYTISLSFGTPPQTLNLVMDTASNLVWFPCTRHYRCDNCTSTGSPAIPSFIPKQSSTAKIVGCLNPKCPLIHSTQDLQCQDCDSDSTNSRNCTQICPPYFIRYGLGSTGGIALSENLNLLNQTISNFIVGCSLTSSRQPTGIAAFGRGPTSLPSQLGLRKFAYCLISRQFDDTEKSSTLVLDSASDSGDAKAVGVSYTPFLNYSEIAGKNAFSVYYYLSLRSITVGGQRVKVPYRFLVPGPDGIGGTIIDSGSTFSFMTGEVFEPLVAEFVAQVTNYSRAQDVELLTGLRPCFNVRGAETLSFPELKFQFKGGADMALSLQNYIALVGDGDAACLTVVTYGSAGPEGVIGPAIILGNFQMQNYHVEYDLRNQRLGFKQEICT
ncbi:aspartic proteinase nepenthesin-1-like [Tripterygium wilfordii]|uniref:Aspartic proteinase nepenthesin-1-like n=1 Tax=Tripterygium wilfordii TaxID=458696 RepID=A0A7J7DZB4_TRIWF|nr:probable aspartyl protease At4g16563 [Tripterygium wilfordii]KAF5751698.1 aspartic proteinase nepenthesin-1-like [Tripterygium wilfordii]